MGRQDTEQLEATIRMLEDEIDVLRSRLHDAPRRVRMLEERVLEARGKVAQAAGQNEKLSAALQETREQLGLRLNIARRYWRRAATARAGIARLGIKNSVMS